MADILVGRAASAAGTADTAGEDTGSAVGEEEGGVEDSPDMHDTAVDIVGIVEEDIAGKGSRDQACIVVDTGAVLLQDMAGTAEGIVEWENVCSNLGAVVVLEEESGRRQKCLECCTVDCWTRQCCNHHLPGSVPLT